MKQPDEGGEKQEAAEEERERKKEERGGGRGKGQGRRGGGGGAEPEEEEEEDEGNYAGGRSFAAEWRGKSGNSSRAAQRRRGGIRHGTGHGRVGGGGRALSLNSLSLPLFSPISFSHWGAKGSGEWNAKRFFIRRLATAIYVPPRAWAGVSGIPSPVKPWPCVAGVQESGHLSALLLMDEAWELRKLFYLSQVQGRLKATVTPLRVALCLLANCAEYQLSVAGAEMCANLVPEAWNRGRLAGMISLPH